MNERGSARMSFGGRKVSTDWAVAYQLLAGVIEESYRAADRAGVPHPITFGHAGNGHPHQNFIAGDPDDLRRIDGVVSETVRHVLSLGGTVSAEHGLGKIKRHWMHTQLGARQVEVMRAIRMALDPAGLFAPGNGPPAPDEP
jgi:FAD/FMN-containing dehydrogenase